VLKDHFNTKSKRDITVQTEYKNWIKTADYIRFWNVRTDSMILLKAGLGSAEVISDITDQRIETLRSTVASSGSQTSVCQISNSSNFTSSNTFSLPTDSVASPVLNVPASLTDLTLLSLVFGGSVGYGEAKTRQGCCSKVLCLDTLRLAIFTKNAIDVSKLDGALAFQIHGFNITFYLNRVTAKGIYTFREISHIRFPQSLEDLPSLLTLVNIKNLLEINHIFWSICKKSEHPDIVEGRYKATQMSLDIMIDPSQDSTRQCVLRFDQ
ncbi:hypothetical protein CU098_006825, partial [Rhizopus stolonifer]